MKLEHLAEQQVAIIGALAAARRDLARLVETLAGAEAKLTNVEARQAELVETLRQACHDEGQ